MKKFGILTLTLGLLTASGANAAESIEETQGRSFAKALGGATPQASGGSDRTRTDSGTVKIVRSPHRHFVVGEQVEIRGNRPHTKTTDRAATLADANDGTRPLR
ncbi:hypothetical protein SAMN04244572_01957 [Azotobacter beijerinckii]|uniref:DUF5666 domain-containing protein n=1 Tax=Azotobacter beijerinckii TaxID=170623 RepID=A0A1H6V0G8_9GAMM|nr:hypothetical protein [Azotobacter beijerinckii]SEI87837.1 hypothetical protein SAMN04244572_01957 [Azotobacter beijerinckii]SEI93775.1 hypothetical protein SAMN04244579_02518 [Azotobacter beijerinckii]